MNPRLLRPRAAVAGGSSLHPEAEAWSAAVVGGGGSASAETLLAVSAFCEAIDSAGIRDKFRRLNLFCGDSDGSLVAVRTPLYRGESLLGTQYGSAQDTAFSFVQGDYTETGTSGGLLGNGSSKYLDTGFQPSTDFPSGASYHFASYIRGTQSITSARHLLNCLASLAQGRYRIQLNNTGSSGGNYSVLSTLGSTSNNATAVNRSPTNGGLILVSRTSTTSLTLYDDAVSIATNTTSTTPALPPSNIYVFATGAPAEFYNGRMAGYSFGSGMTGAQATSYYNAMNTFQTALSRNQA